jgi:hypothetical protein
MSFHAFKVNCNLSFNVSVDSGYMKSLLAVLEMQTIRGKGKGKGNPVTCHRKHREGVDV